MRVLNMFFSPEGLVPADVTYQVEKAKLKKKRYSSFQIILTFAFCLFLNLILDQANKLKKRLRSKGKYKSDTKLL